MMNTAITKNNFKEQVLQKRGLSIVNFYAEWNGASQMMLPVYQQLVESYGSMASFYSVDVDNDPSLKEEYGIIELPTVLFFHNGQAIDFITGLISRNAFIAKLENNFSSYLNK